MVTAEEAFAEHQRQLIHLASLLLLIANRRPEQQAAAVSCSLTWVPCSTFFSGIHAGKPAAASGCRSGSWFRLLKSSRTSFSFCWLINLLAFICFQINPCLKRSLGFLSDSAGGKMPLCNMLWPSQRYHAKRAGPYPCFKNAELQRSDSATQHLCHPSCRHHSHPVQWKRTRAKLDHAVHKGIENSLSPLQRGTFYIQKMRSGSPFLSPHTYKHYSWSKNHRVPATVLIWAAMTNEIKC